MISTNRFWTISFQYLIVDPRVLQLNLGPNRFFYPNVKLCDDCEKDMNFFGSEDEFQSEGISNHNQLYEKIIEHKNYPTDFMTVISITFYTYCISTRLYEHFNSSIYNIKSY